jgi:VanZ family protein
MQKAQRDWIWPLLIVGSVFFASGRSQIASPGWGLSVDKLAHFAVFGALATSLIRLPALSRRGWRGAVAALLITSLYGGLDEWRQSFTPGRSVEWGDWLADTLGAATAVLLYRGWNGYRQLLESQPLRRG